MKDGLDANTNPSHNQTYSEQTNQQNNQLNANLTPKQQAVAAKKAAKLLLREQLKAAGVPFPDDPTPGTMQQSTHVCNIFLLHPTWLMLPFCTHVCPLH